MVSDPVHGVRHPREGSDSTGGGFFSTGNAELTSSTVAGDVSSHAGGRGHSSGMSSLEQLPTGSSTTFTRAQAVRAGYSDHEIRAAVRSGRWIRVRRGSYSWAATGTAVLDVEQAHVLRAHDVAAKLGPGSVLSHQSALLLHGVPVWGVPLGNVLVTRFGASSARTRAGVKSHQRSLTADDVTTVGATTVTTVARALVDLACEVSLEGAVCSMDAALRGAMVSTEMLASALERIKGQAGTGHARRAVAFADAGSESVGESRMRVAISELELPSPVLQHVFRGPSGRVIGRVDFWWPAERVIAEFDGLVKYRDRWAGPSRSSSRRNCGRTHCASSPVRRSCESSGPTCRHGRTSSESCVMRSSVDLIEIQPGPVAAPAPHRTSHRHIRHDDLTEPDGCR